MALRSLTLLRRLRPAPLPSRALSSTPLPDASDAEKIRRLREDGVAPATGRLLADVAAELWEHNPNPAGPGHRSGTRLLEKPLRGPLYANWYMPRPSENPESPMRMSEKQMRWRKKLKMLRASGKGPPKKGAGKRSK